MKDTLEAVLTNLAYIVAGIIAWGWSIPAGMFVIILGIFSGIHHYFGTDTTRTLDYLGMYWVLIGLSSIPLGLDLPTSVAGIFAAGITLVTLFGSSRVVIGTLIGISLVVVGYASGLDPALWVAALLSIAYFFNYYGDKVPSHHGVAHGAWHVVTALAIVEAVKLL